MDFHLTSEKFYLLKEHISNCTQCGEVAKSFERRMKKVERHIPEKEMDGDVEEEIYSEVSNFINSLEKEKKDLLRAEKRDFAKNALIDFLKALFSPGVIAGGGVAVVFIYILKLVDI